MSERDQSLFIIVYDGRETADEVYSILRKLEWKGKIHIKTAATVQRMGGVKLKLKQKRLLTPGTGAAGGGIIGLLLAGSGAGLLAGAVIGGLLGARGRKQRKKLGEFLVDKMGPEDSVLAILVDDADWQAVQDAVAQFDGEELSVELTAAAQDQLAALAADEEVQKAVAEAVLTEDSNEE